MRLQGVIVTVSATDLANHLSCAHLTQQNLKHARGELSPPRWRDLNAETLARRGLEHEAAYLDHLKARHGWDAERVGDELDAATALARTRQLMVQGAPVIVQATLADGRWHGRADVLLRCEVPSELGGHAYRVVDTKLSRTTRAETILQLCLYAELMAGIQGVLPDYVGVVTPDTLTASAVEPEWYRTQDHMAYFRYVKSRLLRAIDSPTESYPDPVPRCELCRWWPECTRRWRADDHLSYVAGIGRSQRRELIEQHADTLGKLAALPLPIPFQPARGAVQTYTRLREQARVQVTGRSGDGNYYELLTVEPARGLCRLPEPCAGDLYFDIEGDHFVGTQGLEYLFGVAYAEGGSDLAFRSFWAFDATSERAAFEAFMDFVAERRQQHPGLHIYHFDHYEPSALKRLMGRYAVREDDIDALLRAHVFVDLHQVVREALIASVECYSIKDLERFYGFTRQVDLQAAGEERARLEHAIELGAVADLSEATRATVLGYNRDDCFSLQALQVWLERLRQQLIDAGTDVPRPAVEHYETSEAFDARRERILALMELLTTGVPEEPEARSPEQHARWLLAHCLDYYRRENKVAYWERFRLQALDVADFFAESNALGGLEFVGEVDGGTARAPVHRYRYPVQDCAIREDELRDDQGNQLGTLVALDPHACTIDVKKRQATRDVHPAGLFTAAVYNVKTLEDSILAMAEWVAARDIMADGAFRCGRELLLGNPPRLVGGTFRGDIDLTRLIGEMSRVALSLDHSVLPIQGPPGSGKTYAGARMILALVTAGRKVGVCANSHKVIQHLLAGVLEAAEERDANVAVGAKPRDAGDLDGTGIEAFTANDRAEAAIRAGLDVLGGTRFLWSREQMRDAVDVLVVDEASQISLTDALAISRAAESVILIGDPRQLDQPQQGTHPPGVEASALDHLLAGAGTVPPERGIFMPRTRRLHPAICAFTSEAFYESRLSALPVLATQTLLRCGVFDRPGLHYVPVTHSGNQSKSMEEVAQVARLYARLLEGGWRDQRGDEKPLTDADVLIVAPYNAQVGALAEALPRARIGTVDKFQGQEAPVVIYTMATSSQEDAPRGMEFLYSANRLNVATSRARCAVILVASPRIFEAECRTPAQIRLANAFCQYLEHTRRSDLQIANTPSSPDREPG